MTRIVHALEEQELVEKRIDENDRRSVRLSATNKGKRLLIRARRRRSEALAQRIDLLSAQEKSALDAALDAVAKLTETLSH